MTTALPKVAAVYAALVDALVPGDNDFPPASAVGTQAWLLDKLRAHRPAGDIEQVMVTLGGDNFVAGGSEARTAAVSRFEREQPELFGFVLRAVYFGYYQSPLVTQAIRALGHDYNDAPQPRGYEVEPFDPNENLPKHSKPYYIPTEKMTRVDLSAINMEA
jgi:hypothetical protein